MKLSEQLRRDHESGDFGKALEGYAEMAEKLEAAAWKSFFDEAVHWRANRNEAVEYADKQLAEYNPILNHP